MGYFLLIFVVIEVLRSTKDNIQPKHSSHQETGAVLDSKTKTQHVTRRLKVEQLSEADDVPTNTHSSQGESQPHIFEDNEARIKMIIKRRSPTMRHMSRTHRVALDWLFDRINLEPKIQIKYVDSKNQLADILTKGSFSRDEWNHLLRLFNIMNFSMSSCSPSVFVRYHELSHIFWLPFQKTFFLSGQRAYCVWCHVDKRTRDRPIQKKALRWQKPHPPIW